MHESGRAASVIVDPDSRRRAGTGGNGMIDLDGVATGADGSAVQALRRPDAIALEFEGRATTFAEIDAVASRIANQLIGSGIAEQERIAYLAKNSDHFFGFLFGACKARVALAPINFRLAAPEGAEIISDSGPRLLMVGADFVERAEKALDLLASKPRLIALGFDREGYVRHDVWIGAAAARDPRLAIEPDDD